MTRGSALRLRRDGAASRASCRHAADLDVRRHRRGCGCAAPSGSRSSPTARRSAPRRRARCPAIEISEMKEMKWLRPGPCGARVAQADGQFVGRQVSARSRRATVVDSAAHYRMLDVVAPFACARGRPFRFDARRARTRDRPILVARRPARARARDAARSRPCARARRDCAGVAARRRRRHRAACARSACRQRRRSRRYWRAAPARAGDALLAARRSGDARRRPRRRDARAARRDLDARRDARRCVAALNAHFARRRHRLRTRRGRTLVRARRATRPTSTTTPARRGGAADLSHRLPRGADARHWRRWLNEIQMLLHEHPVNARASARPRAGQRRLALGGGTLPRVAAPRRRSRRDRRWRRLPISRAASPRTRRDAAREARAVDARDARRRARRAADARRRAHLARRARRWRRSSNASRRAARRARRRRRRGRRVDAAPTVDASAAWPRASRSAPRRAGATRAAPRRAP